MFEPEGPKDRELDPGLKLVWSIPTDRAHGIGNFAAGQLDEFAILLGGTVEN